MSAIILSAFLLVSTASAEPAPAWAVLVYDCERPVGIILNTDPARFFPASSSMTPYVAAQIDAAVSADRVVRLNVWQDCREKRSL